MVLVAKQKNKKNMKTILAILGYFIGLFLGIALLAIFSTATDSDSMSSTFVVGNIMGIICALIGYNISSKKDSDK